MEIKLNIGDIIKKPKITDTFVLHVKSMSGDADEFHTNKMHFDRDEEAFWINIFLEYFVEYSKLGWNAQVDLGNGLLTNPKLKSFDDINYNLHDLVGRDVRSEAGHWAQPDSIWVTYIDLVGIEHNVDIEIDGVAYAKINRSGLQKK